MHTDTSAGSSETDVNELAASPSGAPSTSAQTATTPLGKLANACRSSSGWNSGEVVMGRSVSASSISGGIDRKVYGHPSSAQRIWQSGLVLTPTLPTSHRDLLDAATVSLSTLNADGSIQVSAIWVTVDDHDVVRTSLAKNRRKYVNLLARPVATLFAISPTNPWHTLEIRATVDIVDDDNECSYLRQLLGSYDASLAVFALLAEEERTVVTFHPTRIRI